MLWKLICGCTILALCSFANASSTECGGHGHLHGDHCHCDEGYEELDSVCVPSAQTWMDFVNHAPVGYIWKLLAKKDSDTLSETDVQKFLDLLSGKTESERASSTRTAKDDYGDEGHVEHGHEEHHHEHEDNHGENQVATTEGTSHRRHLLVTCENGHPHGSECHCNPGFVLDPEDPQRCIDDTDAKAEYWIGPQEVLHVSEGKARLNITDFEKALPLIASCQIDSRCALRTSDDQHEHTEESEATQVLWWMVLVASVSLLVIPLLGMALPIAAYKYVSSERTAVVLSLGNCLSAGLIFSLGICHVIPDTVEAMFFTGMSYKLNYLLCVVGFYATLILDNIAHNSEDSFANPHAPSVHGKEQNLEEATPGQVSVGINGHDLGKGQLSKTAEAEPWSLKSFMMKALPILTFFIAIQFHACLECIVIGVQKNTSNFWILFAGVAIHKSFVSFAFGAKLHATRKLDKTSNHAVLWTMALLWSLLPALCLVLGHLLSDGLHPVSKVVLGSLAAGTFLYIGSFEVLGEEFGAHYHPAPGTWGSRRSDTIWKFFMFGLGILLVGGLIAIPHRHD
uniref:Solute carrier family 39 (Zinc transporter), member 1/2/3 n=1 Tax=Tetraselmis sp. GSL018 TaxID=582737 RepID=A0A061S7Q4_9CHLO|eukprot:CAMPEP_0177595868 /NCGR_PEP_ID=MMETSP0419_2-20121207/10640_1 /TAXON_ID=582737 /ORGANISM="Tetraselmis sp., Strain GSL018" /LENGTH=567 /DNA_ID=CAMNT_0019087465 /DNA_START=161 /DNA_END=1864 /DNA_ORIENTATION=-